MNKNGFLCTHWTRTDATSTAPGRPEDTRMGFLLCPFRTREPTMSIRATWCQDESKTLAWLHMRVTEWERMTSSSENRSASDHLITFNIFSRRCHLFSMWVSVLFLHGVSKQIMIYFACAPLDRCVPWFLSFHATCDDHMRYLKRFEKH